MNSKISAAIIGTIVTVVLFVLNPALGLLVILMFVISRMIKSYKANKPARAAEKAYKQDKANGITRDMFGTIVRDTDR
jgi:Na+-transporting methylmalonyl-CoA/oxaloacetate decarboxylase gamma subunit